MRSRLTFDLLPKVTNISSWYSEDKFLNEVKTDLWLFDQGHQYCNSIVTINSMRSRLTFDLLPKVTNIASWYSEDKFLNEVKTDLWLLDQGHQYCNGIVKINY